MYRSAVVPLLLNKVELSIGRGETPIVFENRLDFTQELRNYRGTMAELWRNHRGTIAELWRNHRGTTSKPLQNYHETMVYFSGMFFC
jgi:hypothetical protein